MSESEALGRAWSPFEFGAMNVSLREARQGDEIGELNFEPVVLERDPVMKCSGILPDSLTSEIVAILQSHSLRLMGCVTMTFTIAWQPSLVVMIMRRVVVTSAGTFDCLISSLIRSCHALCRAAWLTEGNSLNSPTATLLTASWSIPTLSSAAK